MTERAEDRLFEEYRRTRDPAVLGRVYDLVSHELLHVALHLTGRPNEAEDLLQATFLVALERADDFDGERRLMPWLLGILTRQARALRTRAARRPDPDRLDFSEPTRPNELAEAREFGDTVDELLLRVPAPFRPVLVLRLRHGLSAAEIAHALGKPPGTVRSQLQRGLEQMRRLLPAGFAGAALFAGASPSRGLAAVREVVLQHAAASVPPLLVATPIVGALMWKKTLLAAAGCLALVSLYVLQTTDLGEPAAASLAPTPVAADLLAPPAEPAPAGRLERVPAEPETRSAAEIREEEPSPAAPAEAQAREPVGRLVVNARWEGSREPVEGERVLVQLFGGRSDFTPELALWTDAEGAAHFEDVPAGNCSVLLLRGRQDSVRIEPGETTELTLRVKRGMEVWGQVSDEYGLPVPHAEIWLSQEWRWDRGHLLAHADEDGFYELSSVGPHHYLGARACGRRGSPVQQVTGAIGDRVRVDLALELPGSSLEGRVLDSAGRPIAGAEVLVGDDRWNGNQRRADGFAMPDQAQPTRAVTDADGRFEVCDAPRGEIPVRARASGYAPGEERVLVQRAEERGLVLTLTAEARVAGTVRDADGRAVPFAEIQRSGEGGHFLFVRTPSDRFGNFELGGLPAGPVHLAAVHPDHGRTEVELQLEAGAVTPWDPELVPDARIAGIVVDTQGRPLLDWRIAAFESDDRTVWHHAETRAPDGRFAVDGVADVPHYLTVHAPKSAGEFPRAVVHDVRPGDAPLVLEIASAKEATGTIEGVVLDAGGRPVEGASLTVWHQQERLWRAFPIEAKSGRLHVERIPPGPCYLEIKSTEHPWLDLGTRLVEAGATLDLGTLTLESSHRVRGTLAGVDDLSSVDVFLFDDSGEAAVVEVEEDRFVSGPVGPGDYTLQVHGDFVVSQRIPLQVPRRGDWERDLRLVRCGLRRVVLDTPEGVPLPPWFWLSADDASGRSVWARTVHQRNGQLVARVSAPPGTYRIHGESETGLRLSAELAITGFEGADPALRVSLVREE